MERTPKQFRFPESKPLSQTPSFSPATLFVCFLFIFCLDILLPASLTPTAAENFLGKTLLLTYAPDCSPKNNVAERALRKSLALSIEKRTGSTFARINEGAYEGPELPMRTRIVGDYEAYSAKVITLDAVKFTEGADGSLRPFYQSVATANGTTVGCTVSEESLKRVGVDVLQLVACPFLSVEDVKQALAVDPCVASVEEDQELTVDVFGTAEIQEGAEKELRFSGGESSDKSDARVFTPLRSHAGQADTRILRGERGRDGQARGAASEQADRAFTAEYAAIFEYEEHPNGMKNPSFRATSINSSADEIQEPAFHHAKPREWKEETSSEQGGALSESGASTLAETSTASTALAVADAPTAPAGIPASVTSAARETSAAVGKSPFFPDRDLQMRAFQDKTVAEKYTPPAAWRSSAVRQQNPSYLKSSLHSVFFGKPGPAEGGTLAAPATSSPGAASQEGDLRRRSEVPTSIGELFFFHAFIPSSKRLGGHPEHIREPESQPRSFSSAGQRFESQHDDLHFPRTAVVAQEDWAAEDVARPAVAAAAPAAGGAQIAQEEAPAVAVQERLPSSHLRVHERGRDDLDISYWRSKSGFHTRAYELASCEKNRVIAVIDTGIAYNHPALAANIWVNEGEIPDNDIDDDNNGFVDDVYGYNFRDNIGDPMDDHGHGTHVAGIIGALDYASDQALPLKMKQSMVEQPPGDEMQEEQEERQHGQERLQREEEQDERTDTEQQKLRDRQQQQREGEDHKQEHDKQRQKEQHKSQPEREPQRHPKKQKDPRYGENQNSGWTRTWGVRAQQGVCGETSIAGLKFMGAAGNGATSDAIKALNYAVQMNMKLSCNSWGGPSWSEALVAALEAADESGHLFIAAAGNQGKNIDEIPHYPASYQLPNVISVAATTIDDELAPFSNRGAKTVDVAAPGVKIRSTFPPDRFKELSGTSMATPVVAGLAAMLMSLPYDNTKQIKEAIIKGVDKIPAVAGLVKSGGRINAEKSVAWLVNELDLDVDFMLQRKQLKLTLPHLYSLFDDALHHLTVARRHRSEGSADEAQEQHLDEERRGPKAEEAVIETDKERKEAQERKFLQHDESGEAAERKKSATARSEKSGRNRDVGQVDDASKKEENGEEVLRLLQEKCVVNCPSPVSM